ncbi:MAG: hypothetical protein AVDCRST_MAG36-1268, partial [uncultured Nocardioidaceae bacterium]
AGAGRGHRHRQGTAGEGRGVRRAQPARRRRPRRGVRRRRRPRGPRTGGRRPGTRRGCHGRADRRGVLAPAGGPTRQPQPPPGAQRQRRERAGEQRPPRRLALPPRPRRAPARGQGAAARAADQRPCGRAGDLGGGQHRAEDGAPPLQAHADARGAGRPAPTRPGRAAHAARLPPRARRQARDPARPRGAAPDPPRDGARRPCRGGAAADRLAPGAPRRVRRLPRVRPQVEGAAVLRHLRPEARARAGRPARRAGADRRDPPPGGAGDGPAAALPPPRRRRRHAARGARAARRPRAGVVVVHPGAADRGGTGDARRGDEVPRHRAQALVRAVRPAGRAAAAPVLRRASGRGHRPGRPRGAPRGAGTDERGRRRPGGQRVPCM